MFNSCSLGSVRTPLKFHEKGLLPSCAGVRSHWLVQESRAYLFPAPRHMSHLQPEISHRIFPPREVASATNRNVFLPREPSYQIYQHASTYKDSDSAKGW